MKSAFAFFLQSMLVVYQATKLQMNPKGEIFISISQSTCRNELSFFIVDRDCFFHFPFH